MGILSVYIFWEWSDRIFQEIMVEVREKIRLVYQTFSINEQLTEISSSEESILTVSYQEGEKLFLSGQSIKYEENQLKTWPILPTDGQNIMSIFWIEEPKGGFYTTSISPWDRRKVWVETLKSVSPVAGGKPTFLRLVIPISSELAGFRARSIEMVLFLSCLNLILLFSLYFIIDILVNKPLQSVGEKMEQILQEEAPAPIKNKVFTFSKIDQTLNHLKLEMENNQRQAITDHLTGLYNRFALDSHLDQLIQSSFEEKKSFSLIFIDFDFFKKVNDFLGHTQGDYVLQQFAQILLGEKRKNDQVFRFGGDEFCIIAEGDANSTSKNLVLRIREHLFSLSDKVYLPEWWLSISVGIADYPFCALDRVGLISAADVSLIIAKQTGRGKTVYFGDLMKISPSIALDFSQLNLEVLSGLAKIIDTRDQLDQNHSIEVAYLSLRFAQFLGLEEASSIRLYQAARLHDLGKLGIETLILNKSGPLSQDERDLIHQHPEIGAKIVQAVEETRPLSLIISSHHERFDGKGYPQGLQGKDIPFLSRIITICDAYHAMTSKRPYRQPRGEREAIEEIRNQAGRQFDPQLVDGFLQMMRESKLSYDSKFEIQF